ncbi:MAG: hypothetical protein WC284_16285 [Candidimonas sp.]
MKSLNASQIDKIIKDSKYSKNQIDAATCGYYGTFALSLYDWLKGYGIDAKLVVFYDSEFDTSDYWYHVAVKAYGAIFDIRGMIDEKIIHKEFATDSYAPIRP